MATVCPSILATTKEQYHEQMERIAPFAKRIQIDLTDGEFAKNQTVNPADAWWPVGIKADFHLMYRHPAKAIDVILKHQPNLIIVHAEADGDFLAFAEKCRSQGVKIGVALLPNTTVDVIAPALSHLDHVLLFSGNLGEYGGHANIDLLSKAQKLKQANDKLEIGWDGGISRQNISQLASGGVDVFDVGGYLQSSEDPERDYYSLARIVEETGTT